MKERFPFPIEIIKSKRKSMAIEIQKSGHVIVRIPLYTSNQATFAFIKEHTEWILKQLEKVQRAKAMQKDIEPLSKEELLHIKEKAKPVFKARVEFYAAQMGVSYHNITLRCQKTRWGSCSSKGNLNFNYLLLLAPKEVLDYVVVHELCHLKEMNHSERFWHEVESVLPEYKKSYAWLKENGGALLRRAGK